MEQNGIGDEAAFKDIDREIKDIVNEAAEFAQTSPEPDPVGAVDRRADRSLNRQTRRHWPATPGGTEMPMQILMPALSPTMTEGKLAKWAKKEGDKVASGDVLAEIETDKATMEVEAVDEGILGRILVPDGTEDVAVNTPIALLLAEGEDALGAGRRRRRRREGRHGAGAVAGCRSRRSTPAPKELPVAARAAGRASIPARRRR